MSSTEPTPNPRSFPRKRPPPFPSPACGGGWGGGGVAAFAGTSGGKSSQPHLLHQLQRLRADIRRDDPFQLDRLRHAAVLEQHLLRPGELFHRQADIWIDILVARCLVKNERRARIVR